MAIHEHSDDTRIYESLILVVDDLASSRNLIASVLRAAGFSRIEFAVDGQDAIDQVGILKPDIIILDLVMPRKSGFEVCDTVRNNLKLDCPILVQSGLEDNLHRAKAFDVGASDLVIKPINPPELISRIKLHLEKRNVIEKLQAYKSRMIDELRVARAMQKALFKDDQVVERIGRAHNLSISTFFEAFEYGTLAPAGRQIRRRPRRRTCHYRPEVAPAAQTTRSIVRKSLWVAQLNGRIIRLFDTQERGFAPTTWLTGGPGGKHAGLCPDIVDS